MADPDVGKDDADATCPPAPMRTGADATSSLAPALSGMARGQIEPGDTYVDEPEHYSVDGQIGVGGMGTVLSAKGSRLGRPVAIKVVTVDRDDLRRRFEREAQITARLQHPAIVPVYGSGRGRDGQPFYAMKQVTGEPLDKVIRNTTTLARRFALLPNVIAVIEAVAYAHAERVIHRDLKPANILVGGFGETVVIDWGLAKDLGTREDESDVESPYRTATGPDAGETSVGKVMGTPAYMPLEQARGEPVDERADVYALGAILYHALAGAAPYARADEGSVPWESMLARVISAPPPALVTLQPEIPPDLLAIVARAMARVPADRYPSAGELAEDLKRFQTGQLVGAHRYSTWELVRRWLRRHRTAVSVAAIAMIVLAGGGVLSIRRILAEQAHTEEQRALAEQQRNVAEVQRGAAVKSRADSEDLLGFMLVDLRDKLKPLGKLDVLSDVAKKAVAYYDRNGDVSDADLSKHATAMENLSHVLSEQGHADPALAEQRAALAIRERLAQKAPTDLAAQRALAVAHDGLGALLQGNRDSAGALAEFLAAQQLVAGLLVHDSTNQAWQQDLVAGYQRLGNSWRIQGKVPAAFVAARMAVLLAITFANAHPDNEIAAQAVGDAETNLASTFVSAGDVANAISWYRAALAVREAYLAAHPDSPLVQAQRSDIHLRVGMELMAQKDNAGALAEYRIALATAEALAASDSSNAERQVSVAGAHLMIGDVLDRMTDYAGALAEIKANQAITERLLANDPTNDMRLQNVLASHDRLGNVLVELKDSAGAEREFRAVREIADTLLLRDPSSEVKQQNAASSRLSLGRFVFGRNDLEGALRELRASLALYDALASRDPTNPLKKAMVAFVHEAVGETLLARHDASGAHGEFAAGLDNIRGALTLKPNPEFQDIANNLARELKSTAPGVR